MTEELKAACLYIEKTLKESSTDWHLAPYLLTVLDALEQTQTELSRAESPSWRTVWQQEAFAEGEKIGYRAGVEAVVKAIKAASEKETSIPHYSGMLLALCTAADLLSEVKP